jgi:H+-transporting ATPase
MEQKITVVRDGRAQQLLTRLLVPGDVILLVGGTAVPADVNWLEGDILSIDTSSLTGEALPRKYPSPKYGKRILAGTIVQAGEAYCLVRKTGSNTEIGNSQEAIMHDKIAIKRSIFEERIFFLVKIVISISLIIVITIFLVQGIARNEFTPKKVQNLISTVLSIMVASVPVALPLVLQVTMALGAGMMARKYNAVVTSLSALQDISSMTILCSDKTGTLTTARISIHDEKIWFSQHEMFTKQDVILYARLASNVDKEDDPIDRSCIEHFQRYATESLKVDLQKCILMRHIGFNPIYKRVIWVYHHPIYGTITIAKGLPNKIVDTSDGGIDDCEFQWKVEHIDLVREEVANISNQLSLNGYKTLGIAIQLGVQQPFRFVGILPMIDPPRHDSAKTIELLQKAGIQVKMITGDHLNIAKETACILGLQTNIYAAEDLRGDNIETYQRIYEADGFSQVLPKDKRKVVEVLKQHYHAVIGMTGDGVNDAPALSVAQCGIAVQGATDAAKNAAAILLTTPGLSAVYSAVIESRRIFRKLRSYIVYRIAATIQIVLSLTLIIFISNCEIEALFIILLALFNDLTLLPIAYDRQKASATPEYPSVRNILILAMVLGVVQTMFTMLWAYVSYRTTFFYSDFDIFGCSLSAQNGIWMELTVSTELLIFSTRAPKLIWNSLYPSICLVFSVLFGSITITLFSGLIPTFGTLYASDLVIIWLYAFLALIIVDFVKYGTLSALGETFTEIEVNSVEEVIKGVKIEEEKEESKEAFVSQEKMEDLEKGGTLAIIPPKHEIVEEKIKDTEDLIRRQETRLKKVDAWIQSPVTYETAVSEALKQAPKRSLSGGELINFERKTSSVAAMIEARRLHSAPASLRTQFAPPTPDDESRFYPAGMLRSGRIILPSNYQRATGSWIDLTRTSISATSLRPHTPAMRALTMTDRARQSFLTRMRSQSK